MLQMLGLPYFILYVLGYTYYPYIYRMTQSGMCLVLYITDCVYDYLFLAVS